MRGLLDINVLIALLDADHPGHDTARQWLISHADEGWASCPITQNGVLRIMTQPAYPNAAAFLDIRARLLEATSHPAHAFWPDELSLLDPNVIDKGSVLGPRQITDVYLLALAVHHRARFLTFDAAVPVSAVAGARRSHLVVL
jgi:toxin-antitoxin system PIN domain toxin